MKRQTVEVSEDAKIDLIAIYDWIANTSDLATALSYIERLENYFQGFDVASERGHLREDIRPNLRVVGFEKRITIAFIVEEDRVVILRIFYGGQNWNDWL